MRQKSYCKCLLNSVKIIHNLSLSFNALFNIILSREAYYYYHLFILHDSCDIDIDLSQQDFRPGAIWGAFYYTGIDNVRLMDSEEVFNGQITGNYHNNLLTGNKDSNSIYGCIGDDTIEGGAGDDSLNGGSDNDTYIFHQGDGIDIISEFPCFPLKLQFHAHFDHTSSGLLIWPRIALAAAIAGFDK